MKWIDKRAKKKGLYNAKRKRVQAKARLEERKWKAQRRLAAYLGIKLPPKQKATQ